MLMLSVDDSSPERVCRHNGQEHEQAIPENDHAVSNNQSIMKQQHALQNCFAVACAMIESGTNSLRVSSCMTQRKPQAMHLAWQSQSR